ncbi:DNA-directed RNA polymerase subunit delta [Ligilactobacillus saerimneri]|uniref:Probable DNA-directed RNA polymerase subunit delta n=1 Tax=Ligilactobacillus saerimneri TaxID=228229 RepID=A0A7H9EI54_9LACO|nr:DNA-directed RNA polymerase subunit delta [Ligilactobacillus saerimneri]QLL77380.1 DNA-directed RNA polymerase subunit delta [Ligilactobacillus saerimneri]
MGLEKFADMNKDELSMIEVAHEILQEHGDTLEFADLTNKVQQFMGKSDEDIRERLTQFYTDLNVDGSFISLGDNMWGLRKWYPYDSIDEALVHTDDDDEGSSSKKHKRVNAFLADVDDDDDDVIDYNDDDPEDTDLDSGYDDDDEENNELKQYSSDLDDFGDDEEDDDLPDGIEGQLSELQDDDDEEEDEDQLN